MAPKTCPAGPEKGRILSGEHVSRFLTGGFDGNGARCEYGIDFTDDTRRIGLRPVPATTHGDGRYGRSDLTRETQPC